MFYNQYFILKTTEYFKLIITIAYDSEQTNEKGKNSVWLPVLRR